MGSAKELVAPSNKSVPGGWTGVSGGLSHWSLDANSVWKTHRSVQAGGTSMCFKSSLSLLFFFDSSLPPLFNLSFLYLKGEFPYSVATVVASEWARLGWECRVEVL